LELYLLRHGEAGKRMNAISKDRERALTSLGKKEMERIAEALAESGYEFDVVATSPLRRALESAAAVNKALKRKGGVEEWPELAPEGNREALLKRLGRMKPDQAVLCVGHEPYLSGVIGELISSGGGSSQSLRILLKKGGLARVTISGFSPRVAGELRWLLTPKQIRKMA
jgi:phosphohistidine phosphatase